MIQVSSLEEYGIRCALQLAREHHQEGNLSASALAKREKLSVEYVSKVMHLLKNSNLVGASRGVNGGFFLTREPSEISLFQVFEGLRSSSKTASENTDSKFCDKFKGKSDSCTHIDDCSVRPVWLILNSYFNDLLAKITLKDLLEREGDMEKRVREFAEAQVYQLEKILHHSQDEAKKTVGVK